MNIITDNPPIGLLNWFINYFCLEDIGHEIERRVLCNSAQWGLEQMRHVDQGCLSFQSCRLDSTKDIRVDEDTVFFTSKVSCVFGNIVSGVDNGIPGSDSGEDYTNSADCSDDVSGENEQYLNLIVEGRIILHDNTFDLHIEDLYAGEQIKWTYREIGVPRNQDLSPRYIANQADWIESLEQEGERFHRRYCPEVFEQPMPVPIRRIMEERMGLNVIAKYKLSPELKKHGKVLFDTETVKVYTDAEECTDTEDEQAITFPRGTVLLDGELFWQRGYGTFMYSMGHECSHWFSDRARQDMLLFLARRNNLPPISETERRKMQDNIERHTDQLAARLLMPRAMVKKVYDEYYETFASVLEFEEQEAYDNTVEMVSKTFEVSKEAARYRLIQLGLIEAEVGKRATRKPTNTKRRIDIVEFFDLFRTDTKFRKRIQKKEYLYVESYIVRNDSKFISKNSVGKYTLTDYAKDHLDECTMLFKVIKERLSGDTFLSSMEMYDDHRLVVLFEKELAESPQRVAEEQEKMKKRYEHYQAISVEPDMQMTFCQFITPFIKKNDEKHYDGITGKYKTITAKEVFHQKTGLHPNKYGMIMADKPAANSPDTRTVLAICVGYDLNMEKTDYALLYAGRALRYWGVELAYRFLIDYCGSEYSTVYDFNKLLRLLGFTEVLGSMEQGGRKSV